MCKGFVFNIFTLFANLYFIARKQCYILIHYVEILI